MSPSKESYHKRFSQRVPDTQVDITFEIGVVKMEEDSSSDADDCGSQFSIVSERDGDDVNGPPNAMRPIGVRYFAAFDDDDDEDPKAIRRITELESELERNTNRERQLLRDWEKEKREWRIEQRNWNGERLRWEDKENRWTDEKWRFEDEKAQWEKGLKLKIQKRDTEKQKLEQEKCQLEADKKKLKEEIQRKKEDESLREANRQKVEEEWSAKCLDHEEAVRKLKLEKRIWEGRKRILETEKSNLEEDKQRWETEKMEWEEENSIWEERKRIWDNQKRHFACEKRRWEQELKSWMDERCKCRSPSKSAPINLSKKNKWKLKHLVKISPK